VLICARLCGRAGGLVATASVNILFGASTAYPMLLAFWALNGLLQVRVTRGRCVGGRSLCSVSRTCVLCGNHGRCCSAHSMAFGILACQSMPWAGGACWPASARGACAPARARILVPGALSRAQPLAGWQSGGLRLQGLGSPACARILTSWYPDRERGTFWGFWTASNNIGGFLAPIIAGNAAAHYGWRCGACTARPCCATSCLNFYTGPACA
jgi:hypothetical protein